MWPLKKIKYVRRKNIALENWLENSIMLNIRRNSMKAVMEFLVS